MEKLYVVVRADLLPGAQIAQSCHAVSAFATRFAEEHREWHRNGKNLIVVSVPDELAIERLLDALEDDHEILCAPFFEPDFGDALTAFAAPGSAGKLLSMLPLALRAPKAARSAGAAPMQAGASGS